MFVAGVRLGHRLGLDLLPLPHISQRAERANRQKQDFPDMMGGIRSICRITTHDWRLQDREVTRISPLNIVWLAVQE